MYYRIVFVAILAIPQLSLGQDTLRIRNTSTDQTLHLWFMPVSKPRRWTLDLVLPAKGSREVSVDSPGVFWLNVRDAAGRDKPLRWRNLQRMLDDDPNSELVVQALYLTETKTGTKNVTQYRTETRTRNYKVTKYVREYFTRPARVWNPATGRYVTVQQQYCRDVPVFETKTAQYTVQVPVTVQVQETKTVAVFNPKVTVRRAGKDYSIDDVLPELNIR